MSNQFLKLRRSAVPGRVPSTSSIDFGEIALNTFDGLAFIKRSGSNGEEVITLGSREGAFTGSFSGSFVGNGAGLFNVPASGIVGLNLSQIATGSVSASVGIGASSFSVVSGSSTFLYVSSSGNVGIGTNAPDNALTINVNSNSGNGIKVTNTNTGNQARAYVSLYNNSGNAAGLSIWGTGTSYANKTIFESTKDFIIATDTSVASGGISKFQIAVGGYNAVTTPQFTLHQNGNLSLGTTTDSGERLQVSGSSRFIGNMVITGSGNTSATNALTVNNSSNSSLLTIDNAGRTTVNEFTATGTTITIGSVGAVVQIVGSYNNYITANRLHFYSAATNIRGTFFGGQGIIVSKNTGTGDLYPSSIFAIDSTNQGFLTPRMTAAQRLAITTPAQGLIVYDTGSATEGLWLYNSGSIPGWQQVLTNSGSQSISGSISINGNTTITGSLTVTDTLTVQRIVAQTITSSTDYVSGSTIFGNSLNNTHQFTGSVSITGSLSLPYLTGGSVLFVSGGAVSQNNSSLFWDNTNGRLGIGTNAPAHALHVVNASSVRFERGGTINFDILNTTGLTNFLRLSAANGSVSVGTIQSIPLYFTINSFPAATLSANSNFIVGSTSDSGERLQVSGSSRFMGDMVITGSGTTSATTALTIVNSSSANMLRMLNDTTLKIGSQNIDIFPTANGSTVSNAGRGLVISTNASSQTDVGALKIVGGYSSALGSDYGLWISHIFTNGTGGTAIHNGLLLNQTINQTGGANGITRGLYVNPTLTAAADFRAVEWSNNISGSTSWGLYGAGTAPNYLAGTLSIGTTGTNQGIRIGRTPTGADSNSMLVNIAIPNTVTTNYRGFLTSIGLNSTGFTLPSLSHFEAVNDGGFTAGVVTNLYGFRESLGTYVATNVYGFYGAIPAATGRWSLYMAGTATNFLAGNLLIGTTSDDTVNRLQVSGSSRFMGNMFITGSTTLRNASGTGSISLFPSSDSILTLSGFYSSGQTNIELSSGGSDSYINAFGAGNRLIIRNNSGITFTAYSSATQYMHVNSSGLIIGGTSTTPTAKLDVRGNTFISGTLDILDAEINYQRNNNVTTGSARLIASIPTASLNAAFFDYVIVSGSNARAGTVTSVWASSSVEWNETYTNDIGSTTDVSLYAAITGSSIGLFATSSINNIWTIKSLIRTI